MNELVLHIFTYHDHLFKIVRKGDERPYLEDEYGTQVELQDAADLKQVREACRSILQRYRAEMSMPGAKS